MKGFTFHGFAHMTGRKISIALIYSCYLGAFIAFYTVCILLTIEGRTVNYSS